MVGLQKASKKKVGKLTGFLFSVIVEPRSICLSPLISSLIKEFIDIFNEPKVLPPVRTHNHHILLLSMAEPVNLIGYHYSHIQKNTIETMVKDMVKQRIF